MVVKKERRSMHASRQRALELLQELRLLQEREGWSQVDLAARMELPLITIHRWHHGKVTPRSQITLDAVEKFLHRHRRKE